MSIALLLVGLFVFSLMVTVALCRAAKQGDERMLASHQTSGAASTCDVCSCRSKPYLNVTRSPSIPTILDK